MAHVAFLFNYLEKHEAEYWESGHCFIGFVDDPCLGRISTGE